MRRPLPRLSGSLLCSEQPLSHSVLVGAPRHTARGLVKCLPLPPCGPSGTRYRPLTGQREVLPVADKRRTRQGQGVWAGA